MASRYGDLTADELAEEIETEEGKLEALQSRLEVVEREFKSAVNWKRGLSRRITTLERRLRRQRTRLTRLRDTARVVPVEYWREERRKARRDLRELRRERAEIRRRVPFASVVTRVRLGERARELDRLIEELADRHRLAEREYRRALRRRRELLGKAEDVQRDIEKGEGAIAGYRDTIEGLAVEKWREERDRLKREIRTVEKGLEEKRKFRYYEIEFVKYYKYVRGVPSRKRHFEIRATFTLPVEVDPETVKDVIEWKFDEVMENLPEGGIMVSQFDEIGWERVEEGKLVKKFESVVEATVYDMDRGYKWKTTIEIGEEEL